LKPLTHLRVLEVPGTVATRYCGRLLARLGAEVAVVGEAPDDTTIGFAGEAGVAYGLWLDAGKRRVDSTADVTAPDLVITSNDPEHVAIGRAARGADAVHLVISWFDPAGPYRDWPATDEIILALNGLAYSFGEPAGPPTLAQGHGPQVIAGANASNAALAALLAPPGTRPSRVDVDVFESSMCLSEVAAIAVLDDPRAVAMRLGVNRFSPTYPCSSYATSDGWVGITCLTPAQWNGLCDAISRPDLAAERRYSTSFRRLMHADEVDAALGPCLLERTTQEWVAEGIARRIPIAPILRPSQVVDHAHWSARRQFVAFDDSSGILAPDLPFRSTSTGFAPDDVDRPAIGGLPLAGLRIVDFSMGWAGPQATRMLGDLGADVIKIESSDHPDWYRGWEADQGGDPPPREMRSNFNALNRNKRGIVLDLASPEGRQHAESLLATADVVIENFAAGVLDKLGLGVEVQQRLRPGVISVSMPAFGNHGPLSAIRAYGSTVEQASSLPFVNGADRWPPSLQHVAFGDPVAGVFAVTAVLSALAGRPRVGGAAIDLAQVACLFELAADAIIAEQMQGGPLARSGNRRERAKVSCVAATAADDDWLALAMPAAGEADGGLDSEDAVVAWAAALDAEEAADQLRALGVPAARVQPVHELVADRQLVASGYWQKAKRRYVGEHTLGAPAFRFDGRRPEITRPAPLLGEHTAEVLAELE
jgi:crotonobetainyl-CoA:carnitine CoA-transferase CaiB-like acyl-CoA transferase